MSQQTEWRVDLELRLFQPSPTPANFDFLYENAELVLDRDALQIRKMEQWCLEWEWLRR